jgi:hypothetical protein
MSDGIEARAVGQDNAAWRITYAATPPPVNRGRLVSDSPNVC